MSGTERNDHKKSNQRIVPLPFSLEYELLARHDADDPNEPENSRDRDWPANPLTNKKEKQNEQKRK
jgi:hypothetical protein